MDEPVIGSEAVAAGALTRHALRRDYIRRGTEITPVARAKAAWLRSKRHGVLAGFSASALHGARWINPARPATIIDTNRRPTCGVEATADRIEEDEICVIDGMRVTTPARTALDLACRYPVDTAVAAIIGPRDPPQDGRRRPACAAIRRKTWNPQCPCRIGSR